MQAFSNSKDLWHIDPIYYVSSLFLIAGNRFTFGIASFSSSNIQPIYLEGKSKAYTEGFNQSYEKKYKNIEKTRSVISSGLGTTTVTVIAIIIRFLNLLEEF